ncbi:unnamed protein product [Calicophoron daubneyi]|uniref:Ensconsin n=1 Tax=Calicophoron daubneyi TaxID=300641 RepID=A0AAV2TB56_CALDB
MASGDQPNGFLPTALEPLDLGHEGLDHNLTNGIVSEMHGEIDDKSDYNRPESASDSQGQHPASNSTSLANLSSEERLRRMRAAEELKQKQKYAAFLESQKQAEMARQKAQEDRKRKIAELRQREEARRTLVLQRRKELEMNNKARIASLRDRSRISEDGYPPDTRRAATHSTFSGRTASASPSLGTARNPNSLMTTSCVVAFGSSAPRSICTQPSEGALRLQHAFEARLASYLTGRHSGCFLTTSASPYYVRLLDLDIDRPSSTLPPQIASNLKRLLKVPSGKPRRRATSAFPSLMRPTKASLARAHTKPAEHGTDDTTSAAARLATVNNGPHNSTGIRAETVTNGNSGHLAAGEHPVSSQVSSARSNSSQDFQRGTRPPRETSRLRSRGPPPKSASCASSTSESIGPPTRSASVDRRHNTATSGPSVFDRLTANIKKNQKSSQDDSKEAQPKPMRSARPNAPSDAKKPTTSSSTTTAKRPTGAPPPPVPKGMSVSVYTDRTDKKRPAKQPAPKRSASPKPDGQSKVSTAAPTEEVKQDELEAESGQDMPKQESPTEPPKSQSSGDEKTEESPVSVPSAAAAVHSGPLVAETHGSGEGATLDESEAAIYRAKLAEQRRLAKERKEEEQRRLEEENKLRRLQQEALRQAAEEAAREEAERAAEEAAALQRQREEEERARIQAAEAEKIAKLQRAEEERIQRKKRLDSIMSRVKHTDKQPSGALPGSNSTPTFAPPPDLLSAGYEPNSGDVGHTEIFKQEPDVTNAFSETGPLHHNGDQHIEDVSSNTKPLKRPAEQEPVSFRLATDTAEENEFLQGNTALEPKEFGDGFTSHPVGNNSADPASSTTKPSDFDLLGGMDIDGTDKHRSSSLSQPPVAGVLPSSHSNPSIMSNSVSADSPTTAILSTNGTNSAPRFRSALLQSMLGGGRLATHAKDAVAGLRHGSYSQLSDTSNSANRSGSRSPDGHGEASADEAGSFNSRAFDVNLGLNNHSDRIDGHKMVHSMYDSTGVKFGVHDSSEADKPEGEPIFAWPPRPEKNDLNSPDSMNSVPLQTPTH